MIEACLAYPLLCAIFIASLFIGPITIEILSSRIRLAPNSLIPIGRDGVGFPNLTMQNFICI